MNLTIAGIALAVAAAVGAWGGYKTTSLHYQHLIDQADKKARADLDAASQRASNAESDWQVWASLQRPKTVTVTREVEREVKADVDCSARPLPDRLRDALTKAGHADDPVVPDPSMPAASSTGIGDLWGRGARLLGGTGGTVGVQGTASSAR